eukprot:CAMPEP_0198207344 /NCGR_PEP_ID=MMETSP1445-20131203/10802_1 /TAXON_ID=36898 /ORGANISM="Pyramimonas sp., Strain CCMP2087" /LENGTH=89 /DNA_ID=CAMNT_0043880337 /DNA_START=156 /DNA_END=425 /DNA_ORIENTATION=-
MAPLQQNMFAAAVGLGMGTYAMVDTKREIWRATAMLVDAMPGAPPPAAALPEPAPLIGPYAYATMIRSWNTGVDKVFGPAIAELSSRRL